MAVGLEWIVVRPDALHDLDAGIVAARMDRDQASARPQRAGERRDDRLRLELGAGARAIGLRGDDEIEIGIRRPRLRDDRIEQELVVLAVDHEHHRPLVDRVAGLRADAGLPVFRQEGLQPGDLLLEFCDVVPGSATSFQTRLLAAAGDCTVSHGASE